MSADVNDIFDLTSQPDASEELAPELQAELARTLAALERVASPATPGDTINAISSMAVDVSKMRDALSALKGSLKQAEAGLVSLMRAAHPGSNEMVVRGEGAVVSLSIPERWSWDKHGLEAEFGAEAELPPCVTRSFSVRRPIFEKMSEAEQVRLRRFLSIDEGTPKLDITVL